MKTQEDIMPMNVNNNILDLVREKEAQAAQKAKRGIILHPAAIGDCILTLPLAKVIKDSFKLGGMDFLGNTDYIGFFTGRTCIDAIYSIESIELYKLYAKTSEFDLDDIDALISFFSDYSCIVTFSDEPNSDFERNLILAANCSHSTEVITLPLKPPEKLSAHLTEFHIQQFVDQYDLSLKPQKICFSDILIRPTEWDVIRGRELLKEIDVDPTCDLVILHPGSGGMHKCWHLDNYLTVAQNLRSKGFEVVFLLGPAELERFDNAKIEDINRVAACLVDLSLTEVLGLLSCTDIFIGNDSGITHLSAGLGIRTVVVFGHTNPSLYRPIGPTVNVIVSEDPNFAKEPSPILQQELFEVLDSITINHFVILLL